MPFLTISELVKAVKGTLIIGDPQLQTSGISTDSRTLKAGEVFFALHGDHYDGHLFLNESIRKGAVACVLSKIPANCALPPANTTAIVKVRDVKTALADCAGFYRRKLGTGLERVGVAGSCGKTTVKEMVSQILAGTAPTASTRGNLNNYIGCPLTVFSLTSRHRYAVIEIGGSAQGEVKYLSRIVSPNVAVITNIHLEHTATFGTLEEIARGESEILSEIEEGGFAVLPRDDAYYEMMKDSVPKDHRIQIKSFGFSPESSVSCIDLVSWPAPQRFKVVHRARDGELLNEFSCVLPVLGRFNVLNALSAVAASLCLNVPVESIQEGLKNFTNTRMRFEILSMKKADLTVINDCYNANPGSMRASLESFVEAFPHQERCAVLGDMLELGEISKKEHYSLGAFLARLPLSRILLVGSQSRFTYDGAREALLSDEAVSYFPGTDALRKALPESLKPGMAILFKASRGMHLEDIIEGLDS